MPRPVFRSIALIAATSTMAAAIGIPASAAADSAATGGPGVLSRHDLSRKDCVGTARNTTSKIWFTVANGALSDVYAPTVDATNLQSLQLIVTDGKSFTDLQTRDMTYSVSSDPTGMSCTVTSRAKSGAYKIVTTYIADPSRDAVIARSHYVPLTNAAHNYRIFARMDANAGGNGGGGTTNGGADNGVIDTSTGAAIPVTYDTSTTSQAVGRDYAVPSYLAMSADQAFGPVSSGFAGTPSDGLTQLESSRHLGPVTATASNGNVEQTAAVNRDKHESFTLTVGFGTSQASAAQTAAAAAQTSYDKARKEYLAQWAAYDRGLRKVNGRLPGMSADQSRTATTDYYQSANVVKASEDKTFPGAVVAGLDAPWGQSISADDPNDLFHTGYREVFARDAYEAWTALYVDGDQGSAQDMVRFLLTKAQQPDGSQPRNSMINGAKAPDAFNTQPDETAYPILMALQSGLAGDASLYPHVKLSANYLIAHGPSYGVERWEEQGGYSPSTIAAEISGLVAAASIARTQGDAASARVWLATADQWQRTIKTWGVTTTGSLSKEPYFIRLSKTGDPNAPISYNLGNGGPTLDQRDVMDLGFLEYVRLGLLPAKDPTIANSLTVADKVLQRPTASGPGWLRYNGDGYGDCVAPSASSCSINGAPWTNGNVGTGHPWPVLGAERAQQALALGSSTTAAGMLAAINKENSGPGLVPEQVWDYSDLAASPYGTDPTTASIGFVNGHADGSASPLTWGAGAQVRLTADLAAGTSLEQPTITTERYVTHQQASTPLTVTTPADQSSVGASTTVSGTAAPGATITIAALATDHNTAATLTTVKVAANGTYSATVPVASGTTTLVVTSTAADGGTASVTRTVVSDVVDGTLLFSATDPSGDDIGPGNYAYPTSSDFHAGAFDLNAFQVYDTGSTVTFRVQTRDLSATFGSTNGAQLVDLYVHNPAAAATSTASSYPGMNYSVALPWSRLIEVQGFGNQRFVDPSGASVGTITSTANSVSKYITFTVDKAALGGTPSAGWGFTLALTGQDGTHGVDQTRAFTSTPSGYTFGECAKASSTPQCSVDPNSVPKVMDTIPPVGTSQADELNYWSGHPVVLAGLTMP